MDGTPQRHGVAALAAVPEIYAQQQVAELWDRGQSVVAHEAYVLALAGNEVEYEEAIEHAVGVVGDNHHPAGCRDVCQVGLRCIRRDLQLLERGGDERSSGSVSRNLGEHLIAALQAQEPF